MVARRLLSGLPDEVRANTNLLLGYPEDSVGRTMSPRYVSVRAGQTAADALSRTRRAGLRPRGCWCYRSPTTSVDCSGWWTCRTS